MFPKRLVPWRHTDALYLYLSSLLNGSVLIMFFSASDMLYMAKTFDKLLEFDFQWSQWFHKLSGFLSTANTLFSGIFLSLDKTTNYPRVLSKAAVFFFFLGGSFKSVVFEIFVQIVEQLVPSFCSGWDFSRFLNIDIY